MKLVIAGASGLIGTLLVERLAQKGHQVVRLSRRATTSATEAFWNPETGEIEAHKLQDSNAVINLSGENIAAKRWDDQQKQKIVTSRTKSTKLIVDTFGAMARKPESLLNASAIGIYGDRGEEFLTEDSRPSSSYLADVCVKWEAEAHRASASGINVQIARIGVVLSTEGGALGKMLPLFKTGLGGNLGSGKQFMSWIDIDDVVAALIFLVEHANLTGPFNLVSPNPVTNAQFSSELGAALHRPAFLPAPALALKLALGEMADELLLGGSRVSSSKLTTAGFSFKYPKLSDSLNHLLHPASPMPDPVSTAGRNG